MLDHAGRIKRFVFKIMPLFSFVFACFSAYMMDRHPQRASLIALLTLLAWIFSIMSIMLVKYVEEKKMQSKTMKVGQFVANWGTQSLLAQALNFPIPFYFLASIPFQWQHIFFWCLYLLSWIIVIWDPFFEKILRHIFSLVLLQTISTFIAFYVILPMLGISLTNSYQLACLMIFIGLPTLTYILHPERKKYLARTIIFSTVVSVVAYFSVALVPAAPLQLKRSLFALGVEQREPIHVSQNFVAPPVLYCFSQIKAPLGLKDKLQHVWKINGRVTHRVLLEISGGSESGFRTWSKVSRPTKGKYECLVTTMLGQVVGRTVAVVE